MNPLVRFLRESVGILVWALILIKLFVFDIDIYLVERYAPSLRRILDFKLFVLLGIVAVLWVSLGKRRFRSFVLYIAAYPLVVLFWKIPMAILRRWPLLIALLPAIYDTLRTFRVTFVVYTVTMIAALAISLSTRREVIVPSLILTGLFLLRHLIGSFRRAYSSSVFSGLARLVKKARLGIESGSFLHTSPPASEVQSQTQTGSETTQPDITGFFLTNWFFTYVAEKVREVAKSRRVDLYLICCWFYTVLVTVTAYAFMYWGLYKITPMAFAGSPGLGFWSFLGFSFDILTPSQLSPVTATTLPSRLFCYSEVACALVILVILVFIILTAAREVYKEDIEEFIAELQKTAVVAERRLQERYNVTIPQVEMICFRGTPDLVNWMRKARGQPQLSAGSGQRQTTDSVAADNESKGDILNGTEPKDV